MLIHANVSEANRTKTPIILLDTNVEQRLATVDNQMRGYKPAKMPAEVLSGKSPPSTTTQIHKPLIQRHNINENNQNLGITIPAKLAKKSKID